MPAKLFPFALGSLDAAARAFNEQIALEFGNRSEVEQNDAQETFVSCNQPKSTFGRVMGAKLKMNHQLFLTFSRIDRGHFYPCLQAYRLPAVVFS